MTIQSVKITNLYGNNYEWQLNPNVNILVGANGTCKSKILELVKLHLQKNYYIICQGFAGEEIPLIKLETNKSYYYCITDQKSHLHSNVKDKLKFDFLIDSIISSKPKYTYSLGENILYNTLAGAAIDTNNRPLVYFLDNPENNLHIDWQRNLIKWIRELNPTCQIIMTTHSPTIWYQGWIESITHIEDIKVN